MQQAAIDPTPFIFAPASEPSQWPRALPFSRVAEQPVPVVGLGRDRTVASHRGDRATGPHAQACGAAAETAAAIWAGT